MTFPDDSPFATTVASDAPALAPAGRARRRFSLPPNAGPALLYLLIALGILWPYRTRAVRDAGDLAVALAMSADARYALREHQFPLRVAPYFVHHLRYPLFQFYGNFPYTVTGGIGLLFRANPYTAWKITMLISLAAGGYFAMRLALLLTRHRAAAMLAGAIFMTAPYLWTDINSRGAFTETIAFCLLPAAFYFTLQCFRSPRPVYIPLAAGGWALVCLTHNITYLYGAGFMGLFLLPLFFTAGAPLPRLARLAGAGALHLLMVLWYVVPQLKMLPLLTIHAHNGSPYPLHTLTPLRVLLAPTLTNTTAGAGTPNLGLQVGWPIQLAVLLAVGGLVLRWRRAAGPLRLATASLIVLFMIALVLAWTPFDFWRHLPQLFWFIQFPYRALMFAALFGSLLGACAVALLLPRGPRASVMVVLLAILGLGISSYVPRHGRLFDGFAKYFEISPGLDNITDYLLASDAAARTSVTNLDPAIDSWDQRMKVTDATSAAAGGLPTVALPSKRVRVHTALKCEYTADRPVLLELPVLDYPGLLDVRDNGRPAPYVNSGRFLALPLRPGAHHLAVRFAGATWANVLGWIGWGGAAAGVILALLRERNARRRPGGPGSGSGSGASAEGTTRAVPIPTVLAGFVAMAACAAVGTARPIRLLFDRTPRVTATADSVADETSAAQNAFDDDEMSAWVAANGEPAVLRASFSHAARLHGLVLEARTTGLYEAYRRVEVVLYYHGHPAYRQAFAFPDAARAAAQTVTFPSIRADGMDLNLSDAVTERPDGAHVDLDDVQPGYAEIRIQWDR